MIDYLAGNLASAIVGQIWPALPHLAMLVPRILADVIYPSSSDPGIILLVLLSLIALAAIVLILRRRKHAR